MRAETKKILLWQEVLAEARTPLKKYLSAFFNEVNVVSKKGERGEKFLTFNKNYKNILFL